MPSDIKEIVKSIREKIASSTNKELNAARLRLIAALEEEYGRE